MKVLENRIPPPILMLAFAAAMWLASRWLGSGSWGTWRYWIAAALALIAGFIAASGVREFRKAHTTVNPVKIRDASSLVTSGIYQRTRNPMYVGLVILLYAFALLLGNISLFIGPALFALYLDRLQIVPEERAMAEKFAAAYASYKAHVRRWI